MLGDVLRRCIRVVVPLGMLALWTGAALADGYVVPKATVVAAPAASWTGCYVGIDTGYKWGQTHLTTPTPYRLNDPTQLSVTTAAESVRTNGELVGGQAGCNYQLTRTVRFGPRGQRDTRFHLRTRRPDSSTPPRAEHRSPY